jgi:hypothetical protein
MRIVRSQPNRPVLKSHAWYVDSPCLDASIISLIVRRLLMLLLKEELPVGNLVRLNYFQRRFSHSHETFSSLLWTNSAASKTPLHNPRYVVFRRQHSSNNAHICFPLSSDYGSSRFLALQTRSGFPRPSKC